MGPKKVSTISPGFIREGLHLECFVYWNSCFVGRCVSISSLYSAHDFKTYEGQRSRVAHSAQVHDLKVLLGSKTHKSASFPLSRVPLFISSILAGLHVIEAIKLSERKKFFVGPHKLFEVNNLINSSGQIVVQPHNTFSEYESLKEQCLSLVETNCIFLFSCGMPSKILINDLLSEKKEITCLDFGSGFDNIVLDQPTRDGQVNPLEMKNFYKKLLT